METPPADDKIKDILKCQMEENRKFREMLTNFIDHKNRKALIEDMHSNREKQSLHEFETLIREMLQASTLVDQQK